MSELKPWKIKRIKPSITWLNGTKFRDIIGIECDENIIVTGIPEEFANQIVTEHNNFDSLRHSLEVAKKAIDEIAEGPNDAISITKWRSIARNAKAEIERIGKKSEK